MQEQMVARLHELEEEFEAGQKLLAEMEARQMHLRESMLRISGAIRVIEELLQQQSHAAALSQS